MSGQNTGIDAYMFNGADSSDEEIRQHWQKVCEDLISLTGKWHETLVVNGNGFDAAAFSGKKIVAPKEKDLYYGYCNVAMDLYENLRETLASVSPQNIQTFDAYFFLSSLGLYQQAKEILDIEVPLQKRAKTTTTPADELSKRRFKKIQETDGDQLSPLEKKVAEVLGNAMEFFAPDERASISLKGKAGETATYRSHSPTPIVSIDPYSLYQEVFASERKRTKYSPIEGLEFFSPVYAKLCSAVRVASDNPEQSVNLIDEVLKDLQLEALLDGGTIFVEPKKCRFRYRNPQPTDGPSVAGVAPVLEGQFGRRGKSQTGATDRQKPKQ